MMNVDTSTTEPSPMNMLTAMLADDPNALFAQIRAQGAVMPVPVSISDGPQTWLVTRMEEAVQVLKDSQIFTVERPTRSQNGTIKSGERTLSPDDFPLVRQSMLGVDGMAHRRLRGLVSKVFTPKYIQGLRPSIQLIADTLLDHVQGQGQMDLVDDFAFPLPINVISDMLGVPHDSWDLIRDGSRTLVEIAPIFTGLGGEARPEQLEKIQIFSTYIESLVAEKRHNPQDDLISQLVQIEEEDRLSEPELISMIGLLIVAGHETTSNLIGNGMLELFKRPDQLAKLQADLGLVPSAIEELLRFCGPVLTVVPRIVTQDVELGGQSIPTGDIILILLPSANQDESIFTDSQELEIVRTLNRHVAFGQGVHICLGAPLARLEGEIALTTLLSRLPNLRLNASQEEISRRISLNVMGLHHLPVAF